MGIGHTSRKYEYLIKIKGKTWKLGHLIGLTWGLFSISSKQIVSNAEAIIIVLEDFSYHPQIHGWGLISFHLKEENAWDIIPSTWEVFFPRGQLLVFIKDWR